MLPAKARTGRLLIVDDDAGAIQTFAVMLRLEGHQVRTAMNALDGLREAAAFRPDGIILDLRMPLVNGLGFLYRLRDRVAERVIPVTIITADATLSDDVQTEIEELGADVCFKPIWDEDLQSLTGRLLSRGLSFQPPYPCHRDGPA